MNLHGGDLNTGRRGRDLKTGLLHGVWYSNLKNLITEMLFTHLNNPNGCNTINKIKKVFFIFKYYEELLSKYKRLASLNLSGTYKKEPRISAP